ncbi:MAG: SIS domain-containing protein [Chloroflexota bacterium]
MNAYSQDILSQPEALREALDHYPLAALEPILRGLNEQAFDRILMAGMGASFNAAYPAYLQLARLPIPVLMINAAELLHSLESLISARTLLWLNSQSGHSVELVRLLEQVQTRPPACILASVNDQASPLAQAADICLPIYAGAEATVSTKTYSNMLAVNTLAATQLSGGNATAALAELQAAAAAMAGYLDDWQQHVHTLDSLLGDFENLFILGRGVSMSSVWNGALICKEAAKCAFEGMHAADFRHGPLELAQPGFTALVLAGSPATAGLNRELALDIAEYGGRSLWVDSVPDPQLPTVLLPKTSELARPLVEILPLQMLTLLMAGRKNIQAGQFRHISKITTKE